MVKGRANTTLESPTKLYQEKSSPARCPGTQGHCLENCPTFKLISSSQHPENRIEKLWPRL